uniref:Uncharacterized protein n=1 Tax=Oryza punctata TaxID=4537 RepID=A0A0E0JHL6_ORYPU
MRTRRLRLDGSGASAEHWWHVLATWGRRDVAWRWPMHGDQAVGGGRVDANAAGRPSGSPQGGFGSGKGAGGGGSSSSMTVGTLSQPGAPPLICGEFLGWFKAVARQRGKLGLPKRCHLVPGSPSAKSSKEADDWQNRGTWASSQGWW